MFTASDHTFVICAYGNSPYLQECISSLLNQSEKSSILLSTSTPSDYIRSIARKNGIEIHVNNGESGIAGDWNAAIACVKTPLVTIAHQDDTYDAEYCSRIVSAANESTRPLIIFTDYGELRDGKIVDNTSMLGVKRFLLFPLKSRRFCSSRFFKRLPLRFGNPICCPSVTYNLVALKKPLFRTGFRSNLDWDAWERFSNLPGSFVYLNYLGMHHRIHRGSETSGCIHDNVRESEDLEMLKRFWPFFFAVLINRCYRSAQNYN